MRKVWCIVISIFVSSGMMYLLGFNSPVYASDCQETALSTEPLFVAAVREQVLLLQVALLQPSFDLNIFTDKDIATALRFHQQYCCQEATNPETCEGKLDGTHYFPESPYLIDHLVSIGMRKFDGIQEHCDILGIDCVTRNNEVLLKERREKSQEIAEDTDGAPPSQLFELFKEYRGDTSTFGTLLMQNKIANAYFTMCAEAIFIRKSLKFNQADGVNQESNWLKNCQLLAQERYLKEAAYVQSIMADRAVTYLTSNLRSYLQTYFVKNRMNTFVDKFGQLDACFNMVLKYVTRTSCCVD